MKNPIILFAALVSFALTAIIPARAAACFGGCYSGYGESYYVSQNGPEYSYQSQTYYYPSYYISNSGYNYSYQNPAYYSPSYYYTPNSGYNYSYSYSYPEYYQPYHQSYQPQQEHGSIGAYGQQHNQHRGR